MSKVFLGGTCSTSTWRQKLIPMLNKDYYNPVVPDWTPECEKTSMEEKEERCNIHLYVITKEMVGVFSIAEAVDSVHNKEKMTIIHVIPDGFEGHMLKSLQAVVNLVNARGAKAFVSSDLSLTADAINKA